MSEKKIVSPPKKPHEIAMENETNDDIQRVLLEQQSRIINEVNSNINAENGRSNDEN
ncbi:MAG: hypothetical protein KKD44_19935 [Proteobacteria bacterium]|nr:hypothetical protein [Pseudomonadota bacterium]